MRFRAPNVFVLICSILLIVSVATWIVPAGEFEKVEVNGRPTVVPGTYERHEIAEQPVTPLRILAGDPGGDGGYRQGIWQVLRAPIKTIKDSHVAATVGFLLLIGGAFAVLQATGALVAALHWLSRVLGDQRLLVIPILMFAFSTGGATFGMAEESILFVMVTVPLAITLRFDTITGVAIPFVGSQVGFATAWLNPFTLQIAKALAGIEMTGEGYRVFCWICATLVATAFVTWHAWRVWQDPSRSLTPEIDAMWRSRIESGEGQPSGAASEVQFTLRHCLVLVVFALTIVAIAVGGSAYDWYIEEIAGAFLAMTLVVGIVAGMRPGAMADEFVSGARDLSGTALLIVFANSVKHVAEDGHIVDTMLHSVAESMGGIGETSAVWLMFMVQCCINFFVPSGSGQAALTMPLMAPLSDVLGVTREHAVLAYQFGDGLTNIIIPTNAVLVGCISAGKVDFATWFRWAWKVELALIALAFLLLAFAPYS